MTKAQKDWIDSASYVQLLRKWRFAPLGDLMFQGDTGEYYSEVMDIRRAKEPEGHVRASKVIGWKNY